MQMQGKTGVVTGATAGIGLVTARRLSGQGANVVIVFLASRARHDAALSDGTGVYPLSDLLDGARVR
jgi:NAD(P)-dependent dehydrogenase (short-subunit alcohol dehydrogenase family)